MSYRDRDYLDEEDIDIHLRTRGRSSPQRPVVLPDRGFRSVRAPYYERESYLTPAISTGVTSVHRTSSTSRRRGASPPSPGLAFAQPVVINKIYNEHSDDDSLASSPPRHHRRGHSRSHSRASFTSSRDSDLALERMRVEMAELELRKRADLDAERTRQDLIRAELRLSAGRDERERDAARRAIEELKRAREHDDYEVQQAKRDLDELKAKRRRDNYEAEVARRELEAFRNAHTRDEYEIEKAKADAAALRLEKQRLDEEKKALAQIARTKKDLEYDADKKELEEFKAAKEREIEEKRIKKEIEMKRLLEEKKEADEKARIEKENKAAIEKYKLEEAEKAAKAKKEKEEREKEYQKRMEDDLRKSGMSDHQIAVVMKKEGAGSVGGVGGAGGGAGNELGRPTYTRMSRRHLSIETLRQYNIDYEYDPDPEYILIRRWVPEHEQDALWQHTRWIREGRTTRTENVLMIEQPHRSKSRHRHHDDELQLVIEKKHKRKPSPSPILSWVAGASRH